MQEASPLVLMVRACYTAHHDRAQVSRVSQPSTPTLTSSVDG